MESVTCSKCMSPDHSERNCALNSLKDSCFTQASQHQPPVSKFQEGGEMEVPPLPVLSQLVCATRGMKGSVFGSLRSVNGNTDAFGVEITTGS